MQCTSIAYGTDGGVSLIDVDVGDPGPGEVQVEVTHCGICAWDVSTFKRGTDAGYAAPAGHEGVGVVHKLGPGVDGLAVGDRVAAGGFTRYGNHAAGEVYRIPESDLADEHWIVEPVSCVVTGLDHCRLKPGDRVACVGCGFMGLMMLQGLVHSFAESVVAIDISDEKLALAKQLGATETINAKDLESESARLAMRERDFDLVVDSSGANPGLALAIAIVKDGGLVNNFGWVRGDCRVDGNDLHCRGITLAHSSPSAKLRDPFPIAIRLLDKGIVDLRPLVSHVVPLEGYSELLTQVVNGDPAYVKGVVKVG